MYKYIKRTIDFCIAFIALIILFVPVSYTHLTLPTILRV